VGNWEEGDDALKEHQCWSPSCGLARGLCVGNNQILSNNQPDKSHQQATRCCDLYCPHFELKPNSRPERRKYYYLYFFFCFYASVITPH